MPNPEGCYPTCFACCPFNELAMHKLLQDVKWYFSHRISVGPEKLVQHVGLQALTTRIGRLKSACDYRQSIRLHFCSGSALKSLTFRDAKVAQIGWQRNRLRTRKLAAHISSKSTKASRSLCLSVGPDDKVSTQKTLKGRKSHIVQL